MKISSFFKIHIFFLLLIFCFFCYPSVALMQTEGEVSDEVAGENNPDEAVGENNPDEAAGSNPVVGITSQIQNPLGPGTGVMDFLKSLVGIIIRAGIPLVILALIYSGFLFVEAQGNPNKLITAKKTLLWTVVGSAVLLGAWTIVTILVNTVGAIVA
jgi:hypothetical protein